MGECEVKVLQGCARNGNAKLTAITQSSCRPKKKKPFSFYSYYVCLCMYMYSYLFMNLDYIRLPFFSSKKKIVLFHWYTWHWQFCNRPASEYGTYIHSPSYLHAYTHVQHRYALTHFFIVYFHLLVWYCCCCCCCLLLL